MCAVLIVWSFGREYPGVNGVLGGEDDIAMDFFHSQHTAITAYQFIRLRERYMGQLDNRSDHAPASTLSISGGIHHLKSMATCEAYRLDDRTRYRYPHHHPPPISFSFRILA